MPRWMNEHIGFLCGEIHYAYLGVFKSRDPPPACDQDLLDRYDDMSHIPRDPFYDYDSLGRHPPSTVHRRALLNRFLHTKIILGMHGIVSGSENGACEEDSQKQMSHRETNTLFLRFPQFPLEVRARIWHFALPDTRNISISAVPIRQEYINESGFWSYRDSFRYVIKAGPPPSLLHTCFESRKAALKHYKLAFGVEIQSDSGVATVLSPPTTYIDGEVDRICFYCNAYSHFDDMEAHTEFYEGQVINTLKQHKVRRIAISSNSLPHHLSTVTNAFRAGVELEEIELFADLELKRFSPIFSRVNFPMTSMSALEGLCREIKADLRGDEWYDPDGQPPGAGILEGIMSRLKIYQRWLDRSLDQLRDKKEPAEKNGDTKEAELEVLPKPRVHLWGIACPEWYIKKAPDILKTYWSRWAELPVDLQDKELEKVKDCEVGYIQETWGVE